MNTKMELLLIGIVGIGLSIGLHLVRGWFEYVTPMLVKIILYCGLGLIAFCGLIKVMDEVKEFVGRMWK